MFRQHLANLDELGASPKRLDFFGRTVHITRINGEVLAFADSCTHIGGPLEFKDGQFVCAWHGACFDGQGHRRSGPAPSGSGLMRLPIEVTEDGRVEYVWKG